MTPQEITAQEIKDLPVTAILESLRKLSFRDQVGVLTELLISGTKNCKWAAQAFVKKQLYRQVAPLMHKYEYRFLISAFIQCDNVYSQNGKPALWPWTNMQWRSHCEQLDLERSQNMKTPVMSDEVLLDLETSISTSRPS